MVSKRVGSKDIIICPLQSFWRSICKQKLRVDHKETEEHKQVLNSMDSIAHF